MLKEFERLKIFFEEPNKEFHLREIARIIKKSPVTVKKYLADFAEKGILSKEKIRGFEIYKANLENKNYKELKKAYNKEKITESGLIEALEKKFNLPTTIIFGSYAKGEDNQNSDIDVFILSETKAEIKLEKYEKLLKKRVQLHIFNKKQFNELKKKNNALFNNIINGTKLAGFIEVR